LRFDRDGSTAALIAQQAGTRKVTKSPRETTDLLTRSTFLAANSVLLRDKFSVGDDNIWFIATGGGTTVAAGTERGRYVVWRPADSSAKHLEKKFSNRMTALALSADASRMFIADGEGLFQVIDTADGRVVWTTILGRGYIVALATDPKKHRVYAADSDGTIRALDVDTHAWESVAEHSELIRAMTVLGDTLALVDQGGDLEVLSTENGASSIEKNWARYRLCALPPGTAAVFLRPLR